VPFGRCAEAMETKAVVPSHPRLIASARKCSDLPYTSGMVYSAYDA
jgi:hypothetical protein